MSDFKINGEFVQGLIANRLHYAQATEVGQMILEDTSVDHSRYIKAEVEYVEHLVSVTAEMLRLACTHSLLGYPDEVNSYFLNEDSRAFPSYPEKEFPETIDEYIDEVAHDLVTMSSISAPDIVSELQDCIQMIIEWIEERTV